MQLASYQAGLAFTRAHVGNVHSLAHSLGGKYNTPHGLANAIILPYVLKVYGKSIHKKMSKIYEYVGFKDLKNKKDRTNFLIEYIENLNKKMNIENNLMDVIKISDIPSLAKHAYKESYHLYPCT